MQHQSLYFYMSARVLSMIDRYIIVCIVYYSLYKINKVFYYINLYFLLFYLTQKYIQLKHLKINRYLPV